MDSNGGSRTRASFLAFLTQLLNFYFLNFSCARLQTRIQALLGRPANHFEVCATPSWIGGLEQVLELAVVKVIESNLSEKKHGRGQK